MIVEGALSTRTPISRKARLAALILLVSCIYFGYNAFALSSSNSVVYSDSTLSSDGSIQRSVSQSKKFTNESAMNSNSWKRSPHAANSDHKFVAKGHFNSVEEIPAYYEYYGAEVSKSGATDGDLEPSTLRRDYTRIDHGFVIEHRWRERVNPGPGIGDMMKAHDEAMEWSMSLQEDALHARIRPEYDPSPYLQRYRSDLMPIMEEVLLRNIYLAIRSKYSGNNLEHLKQSWKDGSSDLRKRLEWWYPAIDVKMFREGPGQTWFLLFIQPLIVGTDLNSKNILSELFASNPERVIRRVDDQPLGNMTVDSLWRKDAGARLAKLGEAKYSGQNNPDYRLAEYMHRILGPYACILCGGIEFQFSMTMPGHVIETNGEQKAPSQADWNFDAKQVYPVGHEMHARSLEANLELQQALTGWAPFTTKEEMLELVTAISDNPTLGEELIRSRDAGRMLSSASLLLAEHFRRKSVPESWFWYCQAASEGDQRALIYLASWYSSRPNPWSRTPQPLLLVPDKRAGYVWYAVAEKHGYDFAAGMRKEVSEDLSPKALEEAESMLNEWTPEKCPWPGS